MDVLPLHPCEPAKRVRDVWTPEPRLSRPRPPSTPQCFTASRALPASPPLPLPRARQTRNAPHTCIGSDGIEEHRPKSGRIRGIGVGELHPEADDHGHVHKVGVRTAESVTQFPEKNMARSRKRVFRRYGQFLRGCGSQILSH